MLNKDIKICKQLSHQEVLDYKNGNCLSGGVVDPLPDDAPEFVKNYYDYYKTNRGYHKRSLNSNGGWNVTSSISFMNMPILQYVGEIKCMFTPYIEKMLILFTLVKIYLKI